MKFCQEWLRITKVLRNSKVTSELCSSSYQQDPVNRMYPVNIKCITGKNYVEVLCKIMQVVFFVVFNP